jgi:site-specific DNA recombinase
MVASFASHLLLLWWFKLPQELHLSYCLRSGVHFIIASSSKKADDWDQQEPQQQIQILQNFIDKIIVGQDRIDIFFIRPAITNALLSDGHSPDAGESDPADTYHVSIPAQLKRCGIETKLIVPGQEQSGAHERTIRAIQDALRKALNWNQALITGKAASKADLARNEGVSSRYITQIIKLAYLAPDIMSAIIKGNIPATLTLVRLKADIPLDWNEQRDLFGFNKTGVTNSWVSTPLPQARIDQRLQEN